ncbi:MAG: sigma-70 family RNA polymerase sigma factor [Dysgonamonadaceae bacterium]|jgi:RNA polymerase sigma-70 factor (ECF subfamily)|nr:sigma-70 family RNA polymerase sigma factor [Dysgonamonadaceae bacterium]
MFKRKSILKLSDEDVLRHYKTSGKAEYFGELYIRYLPVLYGMGLKYLHDANKAQNAVMTIFDDIFLKILQTDIEIFRIWICSLMKNYCLELLQKENQKIDANFNTNVIADREIIYLFSENENETETEAARKKELKLNLKKLPIEQRIATIRFLMEEMSYLDIADSTGYSLNQVKNYIKNGIQNLKNCTQTK